MVSEDALTALHELDTEMGKNWYKHIKKANAADDLLHFPIADGIFDAKLDGLIHAANLSVKHFAKFVQDPSAGIDITKVTQWTGGDPAIRYARTQADFHWNIDTRMWQYFLLITSMRRAFRDAIQNSNRIPGDDEADLLRLNNEFWEEVIVHYSYRTEIIERTRGFAEHPNPDAGSERFGYQYEITWDRDDWSAYEINTLNLDVDDKLIEKDLTERNISNRLNKTNTPEPFPAVEKETKAGIEEAAKVWINAAKNDGLADEYLCVVMGHDENKRWIPTRYVGWQKSIETMTLPYLEEYAGETHGDHRKLNDFDLSNSAIRFGLCQAEFQRRLKGSCAQLIGYLVTQRKGIDCLLETDIGFDISIEDIDSFFDTVYDTVETAFDQAIEINNEDLSDVADGRPVHPRFAPYDSMEPLPWNTDDPEMHKRFMEIRGFTV